MNLTIFREAILWTSKAARATPRTAPPNQQYTFRREYAAPSQAPDVFEQTADTGVYLLCLAADAGGAV